MLISLSTFFISSVLSAQGTLMVDKLAKTSQNYRIPAAQHNFVQLAYTTNRAPTLFTIQNTLPTAQKTSKKLIEKAVVSKKISLDSLLDLLQKSYKETNSFTANFTQKYTNMTFNQIKESTGKIYFSKPGLMRFDYLKPSQKSFIIDGKKLWITEERTKSAFVDNCFKQDGLTASVSFLWGAADIRKDYHTEWFKGIFGAKSDHHIVLIPKKANTVFLKLILVIDPLSYRVKQSIVIDPTGNVNQFKFDDLQFNQVITPITFAPVLKDFQVMPLPGSCSIAR